MAFSRPPVCVEPGDESRSVDFDFAVRRAAAADVVAAGERRDWRPQETCPGADGGDYHAGLLAAYFGVRADLHSSAIDLLLSHEYRGQAPLSAGAYPSSSSLFDWRGVVATDNTIEEIDVGLGSGAQFDPDLSLTRYKPDDSPALRVGQGASATQTFLKYARFPLARVVRMEDGFRFELHDLQFASDDMGPANIFVRVDLDSGLNITKQEFLYASSPDP